MWQTREYMPMIIFIRLAAALALVIFLITFIVRFIFDSETDIDDDR